MPQNFELSILLRASKSADAKASEDIITKFKSQGLYIKKSNFEMLVGVASLPLSFLPSRT